MKKKQNTLKKKLKNEFQPIPFFIALGFALPIHTATYESDASTYPVFASLSETEMNSQVSKADRRPARITPPVSTPRKFLDLNLRLSDSALMVHQKNWQIDDGAIDLLYFHPDNITPSAHADLGLSE